MKTNTIRTIILSALFGSLILLGSGCEKKVVNSPDGSEMSGGKNIEYPDSYEGGSGKVGTLSDTGRNGRNGNLSVNNPDDQSDAYKREHGRCTPGLSPIYFDFDQSTIKSDMSSRMVSNASYMKKNSGISIVIEGNCDSKGTNEYNLALGERRAITAKQYLVNLGIQASRIRTVSYGEERPLFTGQDESSYAMNRRDDFRAE
ncbi:MAG: peptidoglycan-associated lipoprotein Pal [Desulfocapsaceae bacterium]|nr:peptidoglycan-associated lipoprotein Pal [Desulfocapsaceae bacterium]